MKTKDYIALGFGLIPSMAFNAIHLVDSYNTLGTGLNIYVVAGMVIALDISILMLAMYGEEGWCTTLAFFVGCLSFYSFVFPAGEFKGLDWYLIPASIFSFLFAAFVQMYSKRFAKMIDLQKEEQRAFASLEDLQRQKETIAILQTEKTDLQLHIDDMQKRIDSFAKEKVANDSYIESLQMQLQRTATTPNGATQRNATRRKPWSMEGKSEQARIAKYHRWKNKETLTEGESREFEKLSAWMNDRKQLQPEKV